MNRKAKVLPAMELDKTTIPRHRDTSLHHTGRGMRRTHPQRSVRRSEVLACPFHAVQHISHSRRQSVKSSRGAGGEARPGGSRHREPSGSREAAEAAPGEQRLPSATPRGRSQGRGGRHHLVSHPPPPRPRAQREGSAVSHGADRAEGGGKSSPPPAEMKPGTPRPTTHPPVLLGAARPRSDSPPGGGRHRSPAGTRGCCSGTRPLSAVPGTPAREEADAQRGERHRTERLGCPRPPPRCSRTSCSVRRRRRRRRSLPVKGLNREVNREHRKWRVRAGGGGQERGQGYPGQAQPQAALPPPRGGRRAEGGEGRRREGRGKEEKEARPGQAHPHPAPGAAAGPAGAGNRCAPVGAPQSSQLSIF